MNPKGHFGLTLHNESLRYGNRDYEEAIKRGELDDLLLDVGVQEKFSTDNLLFDEWLTFLFYRSGFSGCPTPPNDFNQWDGGGAGIWVLYLTYYDTGAEPNYQDILDPGYYNTRDGMSYNCGSGCGRYMDQVVNGYEIWCDTTTREQIFIRFRYFFFPYEITSNNNNIRGVAIVWSRDCTSDGYAEHKRWIGRVRFKDNEGNFVRINKTNYQAMSLEYTFSMLSV